MGHLLRAVRQSKGLSQKALSALTGTQPSTLSFIEKGRRIPSVDTLDRILRASGHRLAVVPTVRSGAIEAGAAIRREVATGNDRVAYRAFIQYSDNLSAESGVTRVILAAVEPEPTGSRLWDAALAAVTEYWLNSENLPKPEWLDQERRRLFRTASIVDGPFDYGVDENTVPAEFKERGLRIDRSDLERRVAA